MPKDYTSNLSPDQFALIEPLLPAAKSGGRPRSTSLNAVLNAILYLVVQGCKWQDLPSDFPPTGTVYTYFRNWRLDGTWQRLHDYLRDRTRAADGRDPTPSEVVLDSQSVPTAPMVARAVGYDKAKQTKGRKRHTVVDTLGLLMCVAVTAASVPERQGGKQVLQRLHRLGERVRRISLVWVDGGYSGKPFLQWVMDTCRWIVLLVKRPEAAKGFVLLQKRWVVERTFGWWCWYRRLNVDYEYLPESSETMIRIAMIRLMLRRLA
ncbi:transposase [Rubidibacter lacunae KORDI 51-2]|uniref:Transposase n=1 Tax=Rubidibacter lacunae KORDI 51-2 TaxID=582515 RepID=U5DJZ2_9CHRO|nr:IS5 family transposase [Rubidibacter lacunae]ERN40899.1 transposase [Rubidibacter lacunae KORDI 51-2]